MEQVLFFFVAFCAVASAVYFVFAKNPLYAILSLIVTMFSIAGLYILLNAQFLGIVQIIVYAGAIMVLFLYILMMLNLNKADESKKQNLMKFIGVFSAGLLLIGILGAFRGLKFNTFAGNSDAGVGLTKNLGRLLFNEYVLPFELASLLILAGIVSAVLIGKKIYRIMGVNEFIYTDRSVGILHHVVFGAVLSWCSRSFGEKKRHHHFGLCGVDAEFCKPFVGSIFKL
jgi:NADH:ubiquinone oxidoreductase subunit 6 (chain J)